MTTPGKYVFGEGTTDAAAPSVGQLALYAKTDDKLYVINSAGTVTAIGAGTGTVTAVSVATANGFAGTSSGGATPALTLSTSVTGIVKGNGTALSAATAGTDYTAGTSALATGILKNTTGTGAHSIAVAADFPTLNQSTTGTAANVTGTVAFANGGTGQTTGANAMASLFGAATLFSTWTNSQSLMLTTTGGMQRQANFVGMPIKVATTANITLSGLQTIDGYTTVANDRVLVKNQTTASQNGIYLASSGAWSLVADSVSSNGDYQPGRAFMVTSGTTQANTFWATTATTPTYAQVSGGGGGSGTVTSVAATVPSFLSVSGSPITSSGTLAISLSGTALPAANGGTGQTVYAVGDLVYASTTTALSKLADVATGNALISGGVGVAPSYGKIGLTTHVSGTLPVANGGTGVATLSGIPFASGTSAFTAATGSQISTALGSTAISGNAANVTGTVAIANGGTGQTSAANAINALVPSQTGNSGKFLTTNGSTVSWATAGGGGGGATGYAYGGTPGTAPTAAGSQAVAIGDGAQAVFDNSIAMGTSATAGGLDCIAIGNNASASYNSQVSFRANSSNAGSLAFSTQQLSPSAFGYHQWERTILGGPSSSNSGTFTLQVPGGSQYITMPNNGSGAGAYMFSLNLVAFNSSNQDTKCWFIQGAVKYNSSYSLVGTPIGVGTTGVVGDTGALTWDCEIIMDSSNGLQVQMTTDVNVQITAFMDIAQVMQY